MQFLKDFIQEKFIINQNTRYKTKSIDETVEYILNNPEPEPLDHEDEYIKLLGHDKNYIHNISPIYIKVKNLFGNTDQKSLFEIVLRICQQENSKINYVDILYWFPGNSNNQSGFASFATASNVNNMCQWHPEWIHSNKYPFK